MELIKEWTYFVCISLTAAALISSLLPSSSNGKYAKTIVSVFIFLSLVTPLSNSNISFALPEIDEEEIVSDSSSVYDSLVETKIDETLKSGGYTSITTDCGVSLGEDGEIEIESVILYIPDEYDKEEVKSYLYDCLGINAEVYAVGE